RGATFVRVFLVMTLLPMSLIASKFLRYALPMLAMLDLAAAIGVVEIFRRIERVRPRSLRVALAGFAAAAALIPSAVQQISAAPFYGLARNVVGARLGSRGSIFPDDEFYDAGAREAVKAITASAVPGAVVCSDAAAVVSTYLVKYGRPDLRSCSIS